MSKILQTVLAFAITASTAMMPTGAFANSSRAEAEFNDIRKQVGLQPVRYNATLAKAAKTQADFLASKQVLSHTLGGSLRSRVQSAGFRGVVGENLARGQRNVSKAIIDWMHSPGHRANILNNVYGCYGMGDARDAKGKPYWVVIFGRC